MSYPSQGQETNPPAQQVPPQQAPAQQPPQYQPQQQRQPVIVNTTDNQQLSALSAQLNNVVDQIAGVPERLVQAFREAQPPTAPPQQQQIPPQQQQQQPQQPGTGLSAAPPATPPGSPASGQPGGQQLPPGMSQTRARLLGKFFGRQ